MTDLTLTRSGEFGVTHVESDTDAGVDFIDAYAGRIAQVVDSGRIIIPTDDAAELEAAARRVGLRVEHEVAL